MKTCGRCLPVAPRPTAHPRRHADQAGRNAVLSAVAGTNSQQSVVEVVPSAYEESPVPLEGVFRPTQFTPAVDPKFLPAGDAPGVPVP